MQQYVSIKYSKLYEVFVSWLIFKMYAYSVCHAYTNTKLVKSKNPIHTLCITLEGNYYINKILFFVYLWAINLFKSLKVWSSILDIDGGCSRSCVQNMTHGRLYIVPYKNKYWRGTKFGELANRHAIARLNFANIFSIAYQLWP